MKKWVIISLLLVAGKIHAAQPGSATLEIDSRILDAGKRVHTVTHINSTNPISNSGKAARHVRTITRGLLIRSHYAGRAWLRVSGKQDGFISSPHRTGFEFTLFAKSLAGIAVVVTARLAWNHRNRLKEKANHLKERAQSYFGKNNPAVTPAV